MSWVARGLFLLAVLTAGIGNASPSRFWFLHQQHGAVAPPPVTSVTYDTSIGLGVDTNGRTDLTPRVGASKFYVRTSTGSDSNTCAQAQSPSTPKATIKSAEACVTDGAGDHVLIAQGETYPSGFAYIGDKGGFSAQYPVVYQSYDPADPTNQAKWGTATGSNRPDIHIGDGADSTCCGFIQGSGSAHKWRALRGLRFNGENIDSAGLNVYNSNLGTPDYLLAENDDFDTAQVSISSDHNVGRIQHVIFRNSSFHDAWGSGGRGQGIYIDGTDYFTAEDNAFIHAGWKAGLTRADSAAIGGATGQAHPLYEQFDVRNSIIRRNAFVDGSADGGVLKGGGIYQNNLSIENPIGVSFGGGNFYSVYAPLGVYGEASFNAFIGDGWGIDTLNIKQNSGSKFHHNALAFADSQWGLYGLMADDAPDLSAPSSSTNISLPSYPTFDRNTLWQWSTTGTDDQAVHISSSPGLIGDIHATYTNNLWGAATSGTNTNNSGASFANAYTSTTLVQALGYADLATAEAAWKLNPQLHGWRAGPGLFLLGYGVTDPGLVDLTTNMALTAGYAPGYANSGQFIGGHDGSNFSVSGLPAGVTFNSNSLSWTYDGTNTTPSSGTFSVTETNGGNSHTTTLPWSISARPVLSGVSVTAGNGQVTINVSSNTSSGSLFAEAIGNSTAPTPWQIRAGVDAADGYTSGSTLWPHSSQSVIATGAQTPIVLTGLTNGQTYYAQLAQVDGGNNPSLTSTSVSFTPTAGTATQWSAAASSANYTISGTGNTTATHTTGATWDIVVANNAKTSGDFTVTIPTFTAVVQVGFGNASLAGTTVNNHLSVDANAVAYEAWTGNVYVGGSLFATWSPPAWADGDSIKVANASGMVTFYRCTPSCTSLGTVNATALGTSLTPAAATAGNGQVLTGNFTNY